MGKVSEVREDRNVHFFSLWIPMGFFGDFLRIFWEVFGILLGFFG